MHICFRKIHVINNYITNGNDKILFPGDIEVVDDKTVIIDFDYFLQDGKLYIEIDNTFKDKKKKDRADFANRHRPWKLFNKLFAFN